MATQPCKQEHRGALVPYLTPSQTLAFSIGTSIGWGALVVTCSSYLAKAGLVGSVIGTLLGGVIMIAIAKNYSYLMKGYPEAGGSYAFVREQFGHDYGFLAAWFLILTYLAVFWANATSLPLFARYFLGDFFRSHYLYTIFGYEVYAGEIILVITSIAIVACICTVSKKTVARVMVVLAAIIVIGLLACLFSTLTGHAKTAFKFSPSFAPKSPALSQVIYIAYLSPWAFIGFESISHYSEEFTFEKRKLPRVLLGTVVIVTALYICTLFLSVSAYPPTYHTWFEYINDLGNLSGIKALPAFYAVQYYMGDMGILILATTLLALVITSLFGNLIALSRLFFSLSRDGILPRQFGHVNARGIPQASIALTAIASFLIPFVGRTAIGWIVDVTTIGAIVVYALVSASAMRLARTRNDTSALIFGRIGVGITLLFGLYLLVPSLFSNGTMETESYFIFMLWSILGILYFRVVLRHDESNRYGKTIAVWIALLALILFMAIDWMNNVTFTSASEIIGDVQEYYHERTHVEADDEELMFIDDEIRQLRISSSRNTLVFVGLFLTAIGILANNNALMQHRMDAAREELLTTRGMAYRDALTGIRNKLAYTEYEDNLIRRLEGGELEEFALVVFDVNGLKHINDTYGHKAGDEYIRSACTLICTLYKHSPVFRIGGDEFVAVLTGEDYERRQELLETHDRMVESHLETDDVVISAGMCTYSSPDHQHPRDVFEQADARMYRRKQELKKKGARMR